ncbi:MAG: hypothetical protein KDN22_21820 [Verrucomicrobiae bacterium]|nr:hypothetical protein [Verrucomicrobiae bacterium]
MTYPSSNVTPTLDELDRLVDSYAFSYPLHQRIQHLDKATVAALLDEFRSTQSAVNAGHSLVAHALLRRLAELSPEEAVDFCNAYVDDDQVRYNLMFVAAESIAATNIDRALALIPSRSDNRRAWLTGLVEGVGNEGMEKALALFGDADEKLRRRLLERFDPGTSETVVALTSLSTASAHLAELQEPGERTEALNKLLEKVGPLNLSAAIALILDHPDLDWHLDGLFVTAPFRFRPEQTIGEVFKLPEGKRRDELLISCLYSTVVISPEIARRVASAIDDEEMRGDAVRWHALRISEDDPDAAVQFAKEYGLKEDVENEIQIRALQKQISDGDPAGVLESIARAPKESQEALLLAVIRSMTPSWVYNRSVFPKGREAEVLAQIVPLASGKDLDVSKEIGNFIQYWIEEDAAGALQAATNPQLEPVREEIWTRVAATDPIQVIEDALQTGDATIGEAALNGGIKALADDDPKAALDILHTVLDSAQAQYVNGVQVNVVSEALARQLPLGEVWQWTSSLPENFRWNAALTAAAEATNHDFNSASAALLALPPSELKNEALSRLAGTIAEGDPARAFDILKELPVTRSNTGTRERILRDWKEIDAASAAAAADAWENR